jgi:hypothetical protein
LPDGVDVPVNVLVEKSDHATAVALEDDRADAVVLLPTGVRVTVQLDDQLHFLAVEVGDEHSGDALAAELEAAEFAIAEVEPELLFCGHGIVPHRAGMREEDRI